MPRPHTLAQGVACKAAQLAFTLRATHAARRKINANTKPVRLAYLPSLSLSDCHSPSLCPYIPPLTLSPLVFLDCGQKPLGSAVKTA